MEDLQSVNVELSKEERMKLKGRIDRIDDLVRDKEVFVKVMDYQIRRYKIRSRAISESVCSFSLWSI